MQAGVTHAHHQSIMRRLRDERQVINSRQFPFRFFAAYQVGENCLLELGKQRFCDLMQQCEITKLTNTSSFCCHFDTLV